MLEALSDFCDAKTTVMHAGIALCNNSRLVIDHLDWRPSSSHAAVIQADRL
jgi:hypothetical protein